MNIITLVLIIAAFVVFLIAAYGVTARWNLVALGLALYMLSLFATTIVHAQPTPQSREDAQREQRAFERDQRNFNDMRQWTPQEQRRNWRERARWCAEWRHRVERHPRLILPRECFRRG